MAKTRLKKNQSIERLEALQEISAELIRSTTDIRETLKLIVNKAVDLLECDGGSLYLKKPGEELLVFEVAVNRSITVDFETFTIPVSHSGLAAYVFRSGEPLSLEDVYNIPFNDKYRFDASFDLKMNYRTRSVVIHPLKTSKGDKLGVLQLINRKHQRDQAWPSQDLDAIHEMPAFSEDDEKFLQSFAAVASAVLENAQLHREIENLFDGFIKASVHAIEARDPITRGHSDRVAVLCVDLADKVTHASENGDPLLQDIRFTGKQIEEIRYAALLHDFGKIGVREATLQKEEKLTPFEKLDIRKRIESFGSSYEIRRLKEYLHDLTRKGKPPTELEIARIEKAVKEFDHRMEEYWRVIMEANRPTLLDEQRTRELEGIFGVECEDCKGEMSPLLQTHERKSLLIPRGSLTEEEREEIQSHVRYTYEFLKKIPWTRDLASIPEIAAAHHEKLDGSGYPFKATAINIPLQTRILTICDIFDALVASDRPYKKAVPTEKALHILEEEVRDGHIDSRFLKVFIEARSFENPEFLSLLKPSPKQFSTAA